MKRPGAPRWLEPSWQAPRAVRAISTWRTGGVSDPPFDSLNLGLHVGDRSDRVLENRRRLRTALSLPIEPAWLGQEHGASVVAATPGGGARADGSFTRTPGLACAVMTADCLPLFLCERNGAAVALLHVGWRGLARGVIEAGVDALGSPPGRLLAAMGPAIGPGAFEVGDEVRDALTRGRPGARRCFAAAAGGRWLADLYALAAERLDACGVRDVSHPAPGTCTVTQPDRFFSYRRDRRCGRMVSLVWLESPA